MPCAQARSHPHPHAVLTQACAHTCTLPRVHVHTRVLAHTRTLLLPSSGFAFPPWPLWGRLRLRRGFGGCGQFQPRAMASGTAALGRSWAIQRARPPPAAARGWHGVWKVDGTPASGEEQINSPAGPRRPIPLVGSGRLAGR